MDRKELKTICNIFLVVIVVIAVLWWRSEDKRLKQIEKLNSEIAGLTDENAVLQERIEELEEMLEE